VLERIADNAYKLELLGDMNVSIVFNVGDLAPYMGDDLEDLKVNPSQEGETNSY